jgi:tRNA wybutosine-synthesizing protein 1
MSTQRLKKNNMLDMSEVRNFASQLQSKITDFSIMDESEISRIVVLQNNKRYTNRWINGYLSPQ